MNHITQKFGCVEYKFYSYADREKARQLWLSAYTIGDFETFMEGSEIAFDIVEDNDMAFA